MNQKSKIKNQKNGFTLIEMMVAVALFTVVMMVSIGALLSLVDASRKAQGIQSVMNNLNVTLDGTVRALRMGSAYEVRNQNRELSFIPFGGDSTDKWTYSFEENIDSNGELRGRIYKYYKPQGLSRVKVPITASEVDIDEVKFYVSGTVDTDDTDGILQPRVMIIVRGRAGLDKENTTTSFDIQASATQRLLDI